MSDLKQQQAADDFTAQPIARSFFELDIVFANRTEDVQNLAISDGATGMQRIGWNYADGPRPKNVPDTIHDDFKFAFEGVSDLFMRMGVLRQDGSSRNIPVYECHTS